jgi:hypothetical protein
MAVSLFVRSDSEAAAGFLLAAQQTFVIKPIDSPLTKGAC